MFASPVQHIVKQPLPYLVKPNLATNVMGAALETSPPHKESSVINVRLNSALLKAVHRGDAAEVRNLLAEGADVDAIDADSRTALLIIADWGRLETAQHLKIAALLLEYGAKVDVTDHHDHTPLMLAAKWGRIGMVKLLRQYGAEVNAVCAYGHTPLILGRGQRTCRCGGVLATA